MNLALLANQGGRWKVRREGTDEWSVFRDGDYAGSVLRFSPRQYSISLGFGPALDEWFSSQQAAVAAIKRRTIAGRLLGNQRRRRVPSLTRAQSQARVRKLRRAGCKVQTRVLPDGTRVVLKRCPRGARVRGNPHPLAGAGNWVPASGGTETPFETRTGRRLQYVWQPRTGAHAYYDLDRDIILSDEEAQQALGFALLENVRRPPRDWMRRCIRGVEESGAARDPGAVCGAQWQRLPESRRRTIVRREERRLEENPCAPCMLENQTAAPNILGYAVLAGFAALALYAIFRPRPAAAAAITPSAVLPGECKIETTEEFARLETWATRKGIAVVYLPGTSVPPSPESSDLARSFVRAGTNPVYVVVTSDGKFWTYDKGKPMQSSVYREDFCNFRPEQVGQVGQICWLN